MGRFASVDPITKQYPELTPFQFASNTPIQAIDRDGLEAAAINFPSGVSSKDRDDAINGMNHAMAKYGTLPALVVVDAVFTKGYLSRLYIGSEFFSAFNDNRAKTTAGIAQQNKDSWNHLINAGALWAGGKVLGKGAAFAEDLLTLTGRRFDLAVEWMGTAEKAKYVDVTAPVFTKQIEVGTKLVQFRMDGQQGYTGDYFALPGTTPEEIGIPSGRVVNTMNVTVEKPTEALISTHTKDATFYADPSIKVKGGGTQIFSKELKNNVTVDN